MYEENSNDESNENEPYSSAKNIKKQKKKEKSGTSNRLTMAGTRSRIRRLDFERPRKYCKFIVKCKMCHVVFKGNNKSALMKHKATKNMQMHDKLHYHSMEFFFFIGPKPTT